MKDVSADPLPKLPDRRAESHKGDYGRALIIGGSLGMAGAPAMAAMACLRSGAGLVSVGAPRTVQPVVASFSPVYTTHPLADDGERLANAADEPIRQLLEWSTAAAIGPGLGQSDELVELVSQLYQAADQPMVVDADGLNALAKQPDILASPGGSRVLTPHAGEFARLMGSPLASPNSHQERLDKAAELARRDRSGNTVLLLKGSGTIVTDGDRYAINTTGNPGMATGGSGDVLTGVILALLAQRLVPFDAARLGAHVHGLAGDLAAAKLGEIGLIATDLIDALPEAWRLYSD
jgi:ADP-dependent NAD(P)H-hydrate dehydratase